MLLDSAQGRFDRSDVVGVEESTDIGNAEGGFK
ncbi:MAG: hypothetical protein JWR75_1920 [Devosia sp.]|nr:hypothetical protein [Devosia sp.]